MPLSYEPVDHDPFAPDADGSTTFADRWNMQRPDGSKWDMIQPVSTQINPKITALLNGITPEAPPGFFGKGMAITAARLPKDSFTRDTFERLTGTNQPRVQTFPERMVRGALGVVNEAAEGRNPFEALYDMPGAKAPGADDINYEPNMLGRMLGMTAPWRAPGPDSGIAHVFDLAGLSGGAPLAAPRSAGTLGAGAMRQGAKEMSIAKHTDADGYTVYIKAREPGEKIVTPGKDITDPFEARYEPMREGSKYIQSPDGTIKRGGYWMDTPEKEWGINEKDYYKLPIEERMAMEAKQQATAYKPLREQFEDREHIVSKKDLPSNMLMSDTGKPGAAVAALSERAKPFYSAVENAVRDVKQDAMTPEQWRGYLANRPGVKAEELDWVGMPEGKKVTKQQMLDHIDEHGVKVKEIQKSYNDVPEHVLNDAHDQFIEDRGHAPVNRQELLEYIHDRDAYMDSGDMGNYGPKFGEYQLPGGENYREKLFTLPPKPTRSLTAGDHDAVIAQIQKDFERDWEGKTTSAGRKVGSWAREKNKFLDSTEGRQLYDKYWAGVEEEAGGGYQSSHWDEPNVLAHVRMNDRVIDPPTAAQIEDIGARMAKVIGTEPRNLGSGAAVTAVRKGAITSQEAADYSRAKGWSSGYEDKPGTGLKTLHLEELQSDWHQAGRKQGYKNADPVLAKTNYENWRNAEGFNRPKVEWNDLAPADQQQWLDQSVKGEVPDAPFKTTWPDLVLKRMIREAAENGYDAISWTPGEAQAARYDLSKQIKALRYEKNLDGTYNLGANKDPNTWTEIHVGDKIPEAKLADYVGKDVAEKIVKDQGKADERELPGKILSGVDLKVGGEGMKKFYDKMLVDKANALAKKFGGKVEWKSTADQTVKVMPAEANGFRVEYSRDGIGPWFKTKEEAQAKANDHGMKVPILRLTPQLRDTALRKGFPLFSAGVPYPLQPVDHDPFVQEK